MAPQGTKKTSSILAGCFSTKKSIPIQSLLPSTKKPTLARFFPLQAISSYWHIASVRDLFEKKINGRQDNNNNDNKATNNDSLLGEFNKDNDV